MQEKEIIYMIFPVAIGDYAEEFGYGVVRDLVWTRNRNTYA